jgi:hypothetical protein
MSIFGNDRHRSARDGVRAFDCEHASRGRRWSDIVIEERRHEASIRPRAVRRPPFVVGEHAGRGGAGPRRGGRTVWVGLPNERQIAAVDAATLG